MYSQAKGGGSGKKGYRAILLYSNIHYLSAQYLWKIKTFAAKQRFENYKQALLTIEEVAAAYTQMSELEKDGLVKRFELTFDLAWKVMQDYIKYTGYNDIKGPRASITQMAHDGLVDAFVWEEILNARNELTHIYSEEMSRLYLNDIINNFLPAFREYRLQMEKKV